MGAVSLGSAVLMARTKKGLTQKELANILGVHSGTIYSLEKDKNLLRMSYLKRLSEILEIDLADYDDYYRFAINTPGNLKRVRDKLSMTPVQFAKYSEFHVESIRRMENGEHYISRKYFSKLKEKLESGHYM